MVRHFDPACFQVTHFLRLIPFLRFVSMGSDRLLSIDLVDENLECLIGSIFHVCPLVDFCMNCYFCDPFLGKLELWSVWSAKNFPVIWTFGMAWTTELAVQLRACCRVLMRDIIFCLLSSYVNLAGRISLLARSWCFLAYFFGWKAKFFVVGGNDSFLTCSNQLSWSA